MENKDNGKVISKSDIDVFNSEKRKKSADDAEEQRRLDR